STPGGRGPGGGGARWAPQADRPSEPWAMYAIVKTGGKQYGVEKGETLLVERLAADEGATVTLEPLLIAGDKPVFGEAAAKAKVSAKGVGHERGPKLRVFKFNPQRGFKRRTSHRQ